MPGPEEVRFLSLVDRKSVKQIQIFSLILNRDQSVSDRVLLQVLPKLPLLNEIGLLGCVMVTDASLQQMYKPAHFNHLS